MRKVRWSLVGTVALVCSVSTLASTQSRADDPETPRHRVERARVARTASDGGRLGIVIRDLDAEASRSLGAAGGVVVESVRPDSAAARAGIRAADVISRFDGVDVRSARQLTRLVSETPPGRTVVVAIVRDGDARDVEVVVERARREFWPLHDLGERIDRSLRDFEMPEVDLDVRFRPGRLGVGVQDVRGQLAEYFGVTEGVLVTDVRDETPAAAAGMKAGDVITAIDDEAIGDVADLQRYVRYAEGGTLVLGITRDRTTMTIEVTLPPATGRTRGEPL